MTYCFELDMLMQMLKTNNNGTIIPMRTHVWLVILAAFPVQFVPKVNFRTILCTYIRYVRNTGETRSFSLKSLSELN